ncbi:hypothetical protein B0H11DRAFT_2242175 [Mycena galericulata]|nr:hypothetical protein B0H11DRAFT_2242175 [Mycena galericulata]
MSCKRYWSEMFVPEMRPSAAALLKHERVKFSMERRSLLVLKSDLEGRELAISDAMRDIGGKVEHLRSMISDYQEQLNTSPEVLRAALDRREAEMYHMIQAKEQEAKDAFHRREMELLEAQEKRDEDMRFIRARLEKLVSGSKSTGSEIASQWGQGYSSPSGGQSNDRGCVDCNW